MHDTRLASTLRNASDANATESLLVGSSALNKRITATQIDIALKSAPNVYGLSMFSILAIVLVMSYSPSALYFFEPSWKILGWGATMLVVMAASIWMALLHLRTDRSDEWILTGGRYSVVIPAFVVGVCWGSASWLMIPARTSGQELFLLVGMAMIMAAGGGPQAVYRPLARTFTFMLTIVFVAGILRQGDAYHTIIGIPYVVYMFVLVMHGNDLESAVVTAIRLSIVNEALLVKSTAEHQAAIQSQTEAELARAQAESANRAKSTFIAATSHDLRQPLHALMQYMSHLQAKNTDFTLAPTLAKIEESVGAMEGLLNSVLDLSKLSIGAVKPQLQPLDTVAVLQRLDTQIHPLARQKGLLLQVQGCTGQLLCDDSLLDRVLGNIALNAVRYTESGSVIVRARARGKCIRILIADSGIGICSSEKERIFDEFYQVANQARDRRKGLGLGLSIVRDLVPMLGIRLRVKSTLGKGTTFVLDIPQTEAKVQPASPLPPVTAGGVDRVKGALVVLIDDDPLARDAVLTTLKDFGCRVLAASGVKEARQLLCDCDWPAQLVLSDYRLESSETGIDAIQALRADQLERFGDSFPLGAILISGDTAAGELTRVAQSGHRMLHKPVSASVLRSTLNNELAQIAKAPEDTP